MKFNYLKERATKHAQMPFLTSPKESNIIMSDVLYHAKTTRLESITNGGECRESDKLIISSG